MQWGYISPYTTGSDMFKAEFKVDNVCLAIQTR